MTVLNSNDPSIRLAPADESTVEVLAREAGLSPIVARILVARGVSTAADAEHFLSPSLERDWAEATSVAGMTDAAEAVASAVRSGKRIAVFGDFDLDGVSAAAVAARGLIAMGADAFAFVPHRFREGYGLSAAAIERLVQSAPEFVVTVDCGISGAAEVAMLLERGIGVAITDHHEPGEAVPVGVPVADPKLGDGRSCDLAGAGVALKLVQAVGERLGHPDVWRDLADIAMLGTIADVVPLLGENRALVTHGLALAREGRRPGISALCAVAGVSVEELTSERVAFALAPRLNAAGRMADPAISLELLMTDDPLCAEQLATALDEHNKMRQEVERDLTDAAQAQADRLFHEGDRALVLGGEGWHEGVKGIVASRMASLYGVPAFLFSIEDGVASGSGRSVGDVDLFGVLEGVSDLLLRFGGHRAAVGLALPADDLDTFRDRVSQVLSELPAEAFTTTVPADAEVDLEQVSVELGAELAMLEPFGHANRSPLLVARRVFMNGRRRVGRGNEHLKFDAFDGAVSVPAISFRCPGIEDLAERQDAVDVAFELTIDEWRDRKRAQMMVRRIFARDESADAPAAELVEELFARADEILAREEYAGIEEAPSFYTKLAGVTFEGRQSVLEQLMPGSPLRIERQPENPFDANAVALLDPRGEQVGFLNRRLAAVLAPVLDAGVPYDVEVSDVTGGGEGQSLGVNVLLTRRDLTIDPEELTALRAEKRASLAALPAAELDAALTKIFIGDRRLHSAQAEALEHLAAGRSTLVVMATGRGKSLIFHMHAARTALKQGRASVFVYPLRALVNDQAYHLTEAFAEVGLSVRVLNGESSLAERDSAFQALREGELDVALTTPEFLDLYAPRFAQTQRVGFVVVDEAHHVGLARAGNRPSYAKLGEALQVLGAPDVLAVTATASTQTAEVIKSTLGISSVVLDPTVRENLLIEDHRGAKDKDALLFKLIAQGGKTVVYVNSRDKSVELARKVRKQLRTIAGRVAFYNAGMGRSQRQAVERAFRDGDLDVVFATSAFGEGVNIPDVRHVVLYHMPFNAIEFNQMCGRGGRDGAVSRIHVVFGERDARLNELILGSAAPTRDEMAAVYRALKSITPGEDGSLEATNAEICELARPLFVPAKAPEGEKRPAGQFQLNERGVSTTISILREVELVQSDGIGSYRRLTLLPAQGKVDLEASVRYAEGLEEITEFGEFREWVLGARPEELLARFNRPILPEHGDA